MIALERRSMTSVMAAQCVPPRGCSDFVFGFLDQDNEPLQYSYICR